MPDRTRNEAILTALRAAGYRHVTLSVVPTLFRCEDGMGWAELEFNRTYFNNLPVEDLHLLLDEKILPALKRYRSKRIYVSRHGIAIIASRPVDHVPAKRKKVEASSSDGAAAESNE